MAKAGTGVIITGDKALDKILAGLPLRVQKSVFRKAIRPAAREIVLPAAKTNAPVDTGALAGSLQVRALQKKVVMQKRTSGKFAGTMGKVNLNANFVGVQVQTKDGFYQGDQFYGAFSEFGTKERTHKSGKSVGKAPNLAWLRRAVYENENAVTTKAIAAVREALAATPKAK